MYFAISYVADCLGLCMGFRDTGYLPFYFQGYKILSILLSGIRDTVFNFRLFSRINMGALYKGSMRESRGGGGAGGPDPLKNHKNIGFQSNNGPDPLKNYKATKPAFKVLSTLIN